MQISWEQFLADICDLKLKSDRANDGWELKGEYSEAGMRYLSKSFKRNIPADPSPSCQELEDDGLFEEMEDSSTNINPSALQCVNFEYHILYSLSYGVPILYFNAWKADGSLLDIEQVWNLASSQYRHSIKTSKWGAVSQQDHPILGQPFFFFHPCNTAKLLEDLHQEVEKLNTIVSWLSVVGPLVGLTVPLIYAEQN